MQEARELANENTYEYDAHPLEVFDINVCIKYVFVLFIFSFLCIKIG